MEDVQIIDLYWRRSEEAIAQSELKYGAYCRSIAGAILAAREDAEECVSDTWLAAWNAMPPQRPAVLRTFLGRLTRNLSVNRQLHNAAQKRGGGEVAIALEELKECAGGENAETVLEAAELGRVIDTFLRTLPEAECSLFLRRYWYLDSIDAIAQRFGLHTGAVKTRLSRTRGKLKKYLWKEGYVL